MEIRDLYDSNKCLTGKTFVKGESNYGNNHRKR